MDIQNLRTFQTILQQGSYSAAAKRLDYTQSTITAQMKALGQLIGEAPFVFRGKQLQLTTTGKKLVPLADQLLSDYQDITALNQPQVPTGTVRVSVPESVMLCGLGPVFAKYAAKFPAVNLVINNATCIRNREQLLADQADIAVMLWPPLVPHRDLVVRDFGSQPCSVVVGENVAADFSEIVGQPNAHFVTNEKECGYRQAFEAATAGEFNYQTLEVWSLAAIKQTVTAGLGFSFLPDFVMQPELASGELRRVKQVIPSDLHLQLLTRKNWHSPAIDQLIKPMASVLDQI